MPEPLRFYPFLLFALCAVLLLGKGNVSKSGCQGDNLELHHFSFDYDFTVVYLYKTVANTQLIATFFIQDSVLNATFVNGYSDKIFVENSGNIWIRKLDVSDEANYKVTIDKRHGSSEYEVSLVVLVAPATNCKPKIKHINDVLTADLDGKDCGKPIPSWHWLNDLGSLIEENKEIKLPPGKHTCVYYACLKGDALKCAKSSNISDYCSFFKADEEQPLADQEDAGNLRDNTVQEQPLPGQEDAGNLRKNTVQGADQSRLATQDILHLVLTISLPLLVILICKCVKCAPGNQSCLMNPGGFE